MLWMVLACGEGRFEGTLHRDQTYQHDGLERTYHLYEPDSTGDRPLVLLLHGGGGQIDNHIGLGLTDWPHQVWLDIADEDGLFLVVPQGVDRHWNDCRAECTRCPDTDDVGFLLGLLDEVAASFPVDTSRVYVTGESNGGFMTQRLGQEAPDRFAGLGVVIALAPANNDCEAQDVPIPVMFQLGTADEYIPYGGGVGTGDIHVQSAGETAAYWAGVNGCEGEPTTTTYDDLDPTDGSTVTRSAYTCTGAPLVVETQQGAGHVAASIEVQVSSVWERLVGPQNHDVEGARVLWEFFQGD